MTFGSVSMTCSRDGCRIQILSILINLFSVKNKQGITIFWSWEKLFMK